MNKQQLIEMRNYMRYEWTIDDVLSEYAMNIWNNKRYRFEFETTTAEVFVACFKEAMMTPSKQNESEDEEKDIYLECHIDDKKYPCDESGERGPSVCISGEYSPTEGLDLCKNSENNDVN